MVLVDWLISRSIWHLCNYMLNLKHDLDNKCAWLDDSGFELWWMNHDDDTDVLFRVLYWHSTVFKDACSLSVYEIVTTV